MYSWTPYSNNGIDSASFDFSTAALVPPCIQSSQCRRFFDPCPSYLTDGTLPALNRRDHNGDMPISGLLTRRLEFFAKLLKQFKRYDGAAAALARLRPRETTHLVVDKPVLEIGDCDSELGDLDCNSLVGSEAMPLTIPTTEKPCFVRSGDDSKDENNTEWSTLNEVLEGLRPWKKGPLRIFGVDIDTEWRSDWKWDRIKPHLVGRDSLEGKTVADIGCANGYFMFRMLQERPRLIVGIDPNLKAWLEFTALQRFSQQTSTQLKFEVLDANELHFPNCFDVIFCLGVLYHTTDPIGMLRTLWKSMTPGATLIVDCQGIPDQFFTEEERNATNSSNAVEARIVESEMHDGSPGCQGQPLCLVPRGKYAKAGGVWFLPNKKALINWLERANFRDVKIFFAEKLSVEEQRSTSHWANIPSLASALKSDDSSTTIEGYPAPHRFYLRATRG